MAQQIGFGYGALCDSLEKQANEQGYTLGAKAEHFEKIKEAILKLTFAKVLTDSQIDMAYQKLHKQVVKALKPMEDKHE